MPGWREYAPRIQSRLIVTSCQDGFGHEPALKIANQAHPISPDLSVNSQFESISVFWSCTRRHSSPCFAKTSVKT